MIGYKAKVYTMNDNNWHGNSQIVMAEVFRDWVENAPQLPIRQIVNGAKQISARLRKYIDGPNTNDLSGCEEVMSDVVK